MSHIVVFNGSPRKSGHCSQLISELVLGAKVKGVESKIYNMNNANIKGCQGCFHCRTHAECIIDDAFRPVYNDVQNASGILFASPIYFAGITSQAKMCLDRLFPALDGEALTPRWPGKKVVTVFSQGDQNLQRFQTTINAVNGFFSTFGWKLKDTLISGEASSKGLAVSKALLDRAFEVGQTFLS